MEARGRGPWTVALPLPMSQGNKKLSEKSGFPRMSEIGLRAGFPNSFRKNEFFPSQIVLKLASS